MANHPSALKRIRQAEKRRQRNKAALSTLKTHIKRFHLAIQAENVEGAREAFARVQPLVDKTAARGIIHKRKASRILSRLSRKLNALVARQSQAS